MDRVFFRALVGAVLVIGASSCGGGGGGASSQPMPSTSSSGVGGVTSASPTPAASPSTAASGTTVAGSISLIPSDGFGPVTILGVNYGFDNAGTPLVGATVIVGPTAVSGATPPASLPGGDVSTKTSTNGTFSLSVAEPTVAPVLTPDASNTNLATFVIPSNNITGFTPPSSGYYIEVFGVGTDGRSAGVPLPLHGFIAGSMAVALHVSSASSAEASALAIVNSDRQSYAAASPLIFDEAAVEAARLHAYDMASNNYACHYDLRNVGPSSRYLRVGGIGLTGENIGGAGGVTTALAGYQQVESGFLAEENETPPGGHYLNLVDPDHSWAGLAIVQSETQEAYVVDQELVSVPGSVDSVIGSSGYTNSSCGAGISINNS